MRPPPSLPRGMAPLSTPVCTAQPHRVTVARPCASACPQSRAASSRSRAAGHAPLLGGLCVGSVEGVCVKLKAKLVVPSVRLCMNSSLLGLAHASAHLHARTRQCGAWSGLKWCCRVRYTGGPGLAALLAPLRAGTVRVGRGVFRSVAETPIQILAFCWCAAIWWPAHGQCCKICVHRHRPTSEVHTKIYPSECRPLRSHATRLCGCLLDAVGAQMYVYGCACMLEYIRAFLCTTLHPHIHSCFHEEEFDSSFSARQISLEHGLWNNRT